MTNSYWGSARQKEIEKLIVDKINDLYISTRFKYLMQLHDGTYITLNSKDNKKHKPLNDGLIKSHLNGSATIGVFGGNTKGSKFICFDIDQSELIKSKFLTYRLYNTLLEMNIKEEYIYISYSGNKGYHVEIFFDKFIDNRLIKRFYELTINNGEFHDIEEGRIELRPIRQDVGVKIPLGVHKKTKNKCYYVDINNDLKPIEDVQYVLSIKKNESKRIYGYNRGR